MQADSPTPGLASSGSISAVPGPMPLFHAAWLFAVGIVAAHWYWMPPSWVLIALGLAAGLACLAAFQGAACRLDAAWGPVVPARRLVRLDAATASARAGVGPVVG